MSGTADARRPFSRATTHQSRHRPQFCPLKLPIGWSVVVRAPPASGLRGGAGLHEAPTVMSASSITRGKTSAAALGWLPVACERFPVACGSIPPARAFSMTENKETGGLPRTVVDSRGLRGKAHRQSAPRCHTETARCSCQQRAVASWSRRPRLWLTLGLEALKFRLTNLAGLRPRRTP